MSLPGRIFYSIKNYLDDAKKNRHIRKTINNFTNYYSGSDDQEILQMLSFYKSGKIRPFPYLFIEKYVNRNIDVFHDDSLDLPYVVHGTNKLYFPRELNNSSITRMYNGLCLEQDPQCPHCYTHSDFNISENDVLIDVGCADGLFTLEHIEQVNKAYLFEVEERWMEPLNATFKPWLFKTEIIKALVSNKNEGSMVTLESIIEDKIENCFIKIDVEGHEGEVIQGASAFLCRNDINIKMAIASYHNQSDYDELSKQIEELGFNTVASDGYILFYYDEQIAPPYLRKCIIRAKNC